MGLPLVVTVNEMSNKGDECSFCHRGKVISVNIHIYMYLSKLQLLHKLSMQIRYSLNASGSSYQIQHSH